MSRSLFAILSQRFGRPVDRAARREFLQGSLALGATLIQSSSAFATSARVASGRRVVVVGAGFSGLACAFELRRMGYDVTVVEARRRLGSRLVDGLGNLHFAGEHVCYKFVGYIEGALSSGVQVARKLAQWDSV